MIPLPEFDASGITATVPWIAWLPTLLSAAPTDAFTRDVVPLLASGEVRPVVARTMPLDDAPAAYDLLASHAVFGPIVLDLT